jgi:hypothetical protein
MSYRNVFVSLYGFLRNKKLKIDGSNFINWYQRLRDILTSNDMLYTIGEPLVDELKNSVDEDDNGDYHTRHDLSICHALLLRFWAASALLEHQRIWYGWWT